MKKFAFEFLRRGLIACGFGPVVLAIVYLILQQTTGVETLSVNQVSTGILSLTALVFIAGGMNALYQIERLPLLVAVLIHGCALYISYLGVYLINDWLEQGIIPIIVFSSVFVVGYLAIWAVIYSIIRKNTARINESLRKRQQSPDDVR